jgi:hypothetical protein
VSDTTNRSAIAYTALVAAVIIPQVQKRFGITLTIDDVSAYMAGAAVAWHALSAFVDSRWPPKAQQNPAQIEAVTRAVLAELKSTTPFVQQPVTPATQETTK